MKRRVIAALLTLTMVFSLTACGGSKSDSSKDSSKKEEKEATVDTVKDPITISFWHDRTSDTDYAWLKESIDEFNKTNKYGITVEEVGQGYLDDVQAALTTAIAAGDSPVLADLSCNGLPLVASEDVLADMTPYIERDNFDMDNVVKELTDYVYYDKQVVTMPYTRGTAILYYNKDLYANAGLNQAPTSLEELNEYAKKIYDNSNGEVKGVGYTIEPTYYQHYLLESLNDVGFMDADGKGASCLDDGSMKQFLTDWYNWTEEGWCEIPALENASSAMQEDFYNGKLGAFVSSSNRATSISEKAQAAGINLGMSYTVGYGGYSAPLGGGSIGIIGKDHSQQLLRIGGGLQQERQPAEHLRQLGMSVQVCGELRRRQRQGGRNGLEKDDLRPALARRDEVGRRHRTFERRDRKSVV